MLLGTTFLKEDLLEDEKRKFLIESNYLNDQRTMEIWQIDEHEIIVG
jgi:hypothetical protein